MPVQQPDTQIRNLLTKLIASQKNIDNSLGQINYTLHQIDGNLNTLAEAIIDLTKKKDVESNDDE